MTVSANDQPEFDDTVLADVAASLPAPQLAEFLEDYLASGAKHIERVLALHEAGDVAALGREAHTLISVTGSYGLKRASAIARQLEAACKAPQADQIAALVGELATASRQGWEALRRRFLPAAKA
jgi:HPt (histidine-containing phosphotransfer) domain-containing protein